MTQPLSTTLAQQANDIVQKKRNNWAELGEATHHLDLKLQVMAQSALAEIAILPTTINDIPVAEQKLKDVKRKFVEIETERKIVTSRLESIKDRLMLPEKTGSAPIALYEQAIIKIKKTDEDKRKQDKIKEDNIKACKEFLIKHKNDSINHFNTKIISAVDGAYTWALGEGNITKENLQEFLTKALTKFTANHFLLTVPANSFQYINMEDYKKLTDELLVVDPSAFLADYSHKLKHKFSDYEIALNNKAQALENARIEKEAAEKKLLEEKKNAEIAAQLSSVAVNPVVESGVKKLKSSWEVDMEETEANSLIIMAAFVGNITLCRVHLRVTKWNSLSILQMRGALAKCKTVDEAFAPAGIIFKTIDKL